MSSLGMIWGIVKMAATKIPWGTVVENAPAVADLVGRAKDSLKASSQDDLVEQLRLIHEENQKLEKVLLQTANHLQDLEKTLSVVVARQKNWAIVTVFSMLIAISSLVLWITK